MANTSTLEVSFIDKSIALRPTVGGVVGQWEYHPICNFVSLTSQPHLGFATRDAGTNQRDHRYKWADLLKITIRSTAGEGKEPVQFDLNQVTNQVGWTLNAAGVTQCIADINSWIGQCSDPSGGAGGGALEATQQAVLTAVQNHQDFEMKLVRDDGAAGKVICERAEYDETAGTYSYSYTDVGGTPYVTVGPLTYLDPSAVLNLILADAQEQKTPTKVVSTGITVIPIGASEISIFNNGAGAGTSNGGVLPAGVEETYGFDNEIDTVITVDGLTTEQMIITYMI